MDRAHSVATAFLIEDDSDVIVRVHRLLSELGYAVNVVSTRRSLDVQLTQNSPSLVLLAIERGRSQQLGYLRAIQSLYPRALSVGYSVEYTAEVLTEAMSAGVRRVLQYPFSSGALRQSIDSVMDELRGLSAQSGPEPEFPHHQVRPSPPANPPWSGKLTHQLIVVTSPKGGVGTSTLAVNLACALQLLGATTSLVDANLNFASHAVFLDLHPDRSIADLVGSEDITPARVRSTLTRHASGLEVLLGPEEPEEGERVLSEHVLQILTALRDRYEFTIVDACPCFDGRVLAAIELADTVLVPVCPDLPTMKNVNSYLRVVSLLHFDIEKLNLVMVRSDSIGPRELKQIEAALKRPIHLQIVSDGRRTTEAANTGVPFIISSPDAQISQDVFGIAQFLVSNAAGEQNASQSRKQSLFGRLLGH